MAAVARARAGEVQLHPARAPARAPGAGIARGGPGTHSLEGYDLHHCWKPQRPTTIVPSCLWLQADRLAFLWLMSDGHQVTGIGVGIWMHQISTRHPTHMHMHLDAGRNARGQQVRRQPSRLHPLGAPPGHAPHVADCTGE